MNKILRFILSLAETVVNSVRIEDDSIIVGVRPYKSKQRRCPVCGCVCETYDGRSSPRRWRTLDMGISKCYLEYAPVRVRCSVHGVHVESVPWASPKSRFTRPFEDWVAWMAVYCTISAVAEDLDGTVSGVQSAIALEAPGSAAFILINSKAGTSTWSVCSTTGMTSTSANEV